MRVENQSPTGCLTVRERRGSQCALPNGAGVGGERDRAASAPALFMRVENQSPTGLLDRERSLSDVAAVAAGGVEWPLTVAGRSRRAGWGKALPVRAVPPRTETRAEPRAGADYGPAEAPSATAMRRHAWRWGVARGRCRTMRRAEPTTCTPQLQQPVAQPRHLGAGAVGPRCTQPQLLHEYVGRRGQQHPQLVRQELAAARAVDLQVPPRRTCRFPQSSSQWSAGGMVRSVQAPTWVARPASSRRAMARRALWRGAAGGPTDMFGFASGLLAYRATRTGSDSRRGRVGRCAAERDDGDADGPGRGFTGANRR